MLDKGILNLPRLRQLRMDLLNIRTRIESFGRHQVAAELKRQMA